MTWTVNLLGAHRNHKIASVGTMNSTTINKTYLVFDPYKAHINLTLYHTTRKDFKPYGYSVLILGSLCSGACCAMSP